MVQTQKHTVELTRKYQAHMQCQEVRDLQCEMRRNCTESDWLTLESEVTQGRKNPLWMGLAARLSELRRTAGITQLALAKYSGCGGPLISAIESQTQRPKLDTIERLSAGLGVSPTYLAFGPEGYAPFKPKLPSYLRSDYQPVAELSLGRSVERHQDCGERLRSKREALGLSLRALAKAADVSYQAVLYTESGQTVPRVDTIEAIAVALDVAPGWLAYGEDE